MVGVIGFEPTTHWSQASCATRLRYTPKIIYILYINYIEALSLFLPLALLALITFLPPAVAILALKPCLFLLATLLG